MTRTAGTCACATGSVWPLPSTAARSASAGTIKANPAIQSAIRSVIMEASIEQNAQQVCRAFCLISLVHRVDNEVAATQQNDGDADEQEDRHDRSPCYSCTDITLCCPRRSKIKAAP